MKTLSNSLPSMERLSHPNGNIIGGGQREEETAEFILAPCTHMLRKARCQVYLQAGGSVCM